MPEVAFTALADQLKKADRDRQVEPNPNIRRIASYRADPTEEGRRIANASAAAFREAIKVKSSNNR